MNTRKTLKQNPENIKLNNFNSHWYISKEVVSAQWRRTVLESRFDILIIAILIADRYPEGHKVMKVSSRVGFAQYVDEFRLKLNRNVA